MTYTLLKWWWGYIFHNNLWMIYYYKNSSQFLETCYLEKVIIQMKYGTILEVLRWSVLVSAQ